MWRPVFPTHRIHGGRSVGTRRQPEDKQHAGILTVNLVELVALWGKLR